VRAWCGVSVPGRVSATGLRTTRARRAGGVYTRPTPRVDGSAVRVQLRRDAQIRCLDIQPHIYTGAMALSIKSPEADRLARELAATTGESLTDAVTEALRERLAREHDRRAVDMRRQLLRLVDEVRRMPVLDDRPADEILGYDERGLPT